MKKTDKYIEELEENLGVAIFFIILLICIIGVLSYKLIDIYYNFQIVSLINNI